MIYCILLIEAYRKTVDGSRLSIIFRVRTVARIQRPCRRWQTCERVRMCVCMRTAFSAVLPYMIPAELFPVKHMCSAMLLLLSSQNQTDSYKFCHTGLLLIRHAPRQFIISNESYRNSPMYRSQFSCGLGSTFADTNTDQCIADAIKCHSIVEALPLSFSLFRSVGGSSLF